MKVFSGFMIGIMFLVVLAIAAVVAVSVYTDRARKTALKRLMAIAEEKGIPVSPRYIFRNLERLNLWDLKNIDDWLAAVEKNDAAEAVAAWPKAADAMKKTDLGLVFGAAGALLNVFK